MDVLRTFNTLASRTSFYAMLVCRVMLGCPAFVIYKSYKKYQDWLGRKVYRFNGDLVDPVRLGDLQARVQ